ncbi:MAG: hypothetical protein GY839_11630 [candidate division Zixibacteria bacterium]|nr:hypothetical protein [candidate division Zixibacteria bacterium]
MGTIKAIQTAELAASAVENDIQKYVNLINANIKPPVPVTASDVIIRAMYIVSDGINSYGGRFDRTDLPAIARLFIDSPVLIGHDKSGLPVARNFWAEAVEKGSRLWIKSYFYWLRETDGASRLKLNIDSGIYKECSVSFTYTMPECTACGKDMRFCGHQVGEDIFFYYRGVERVLETSLVYRGSIPDTSITDQLVADSYLDSNTLKPDNQAVYTIAPGAYNMAGLMTHKGIRARLNNHSFILAIEDEAA